MIMRYESFLCLHVFPQCSLVPKRLAGRTADQEREEGAADVDDDEDEEDKYSDDETEDDEDNADVWRWSPGRPLGSEGLLVDVPAVVPRGHRAEPLWARSSFQVATVVILRGTPRLARGVLGARCHEQLWPSLERRAASAMAHGADSTVIGQLSGTKKTHKHTDFGRDFFCPCIKFKGFLLAAVSMHTLLNGLMIMCATRSSRCTLASTIVRRTSGNT